MNKYHAMQIGKLLYGDNYKKAIGRALEVKPNTVKYLLNGQYQFKEVFQQRLFIELDKKINEIKLIKEFYKNGIQKFNFIESDKYATIFNAKHGMVTIEKKQIDEYINNNKNFIHIVVFGYIDSPYIFIWKEIFKQVMYEDSCCIGYNQLKSTLEQLELHFNLVAYTVFID